MKEILLNILKWKLKKLAQLTIWKYRPGIIGITGSVGKTSTKLAIAAILSGDRHIRISEASLNTELGVSLTVLGDWHEREWRLFSRFEKPGTNRIRKLIFLSKVIVVSIVHLLFGRKEKYPEILILEYGIDHPGDMKRLLEIARPNISVITAIGDIPVHVEFFSGPEEVAREKAKLIEYLPSAGFAILNSDDETVVELKNRTRAHIMTFGFSREAEVRITNFENRSEKQKPIGISFKLGYGGSFVPVKLDNIFGKAQGYAASAAAAVGLIFGLNLVRISEALKNYKPAEGRMNLLTGVKYTRVIDDSYNASPLSMHAALDTLRDLPGKRKIAVLGDMLEIGRYSIEAHEYIGRLAAEIVDVLITVGPRAKFIAEGARNKGMRRKNILSFDIAEEARVPVQSVLKKGDLILVKGSHAIGLTKVVEEIKAF